MRQHTWELFDWKDPIRYAAVFRIECKACGSDLQHTCSEEVLQQHIQGTNSLVHHIKMTLMKAVLTTYPDDCEFTRQLNIARQVHES